MRVHIREHDIGDLCRLVTVAWDGGLLAAAYSKASAMKTLRDRLDPGFKRTETAHDLQNELEDQIVRYLEGGLPRFDLPLDTSGLPDFTSRVLVGCASIRRGELMTYGDLAARAGSPGGGRAVGQVMNRNPFALIVPCHRVVGSGGRLGGFAPGTALKRRLLAHEGVSTTVDRIVPIQA